MGAIFRLDALQFIAKSAVEDVTSEAVSQATDNFQTPSMYAWRIWLPTLALQCGMSPTERLSLEEIGVTPLRRVSRTSLAGMQKESQATRASTR